MFNSIRCYPISQINLFVVRGGGGGGSFPPSFFFFFCFPQKKKKFFFLGGGGGGGDLTPVLFRDINLKFGDNLNFLI